MIKKTQNEKKTQKGKKRKNYLKPPKTEIY